MTETFLSFVFPLMIQALVSMTGWSEFLSAWGGLLAAVFLVFACLAVWVLNLISLPGNWFGVAILVGYALWGPDEGRIAIGWLPVAIAFGFALVGEIVEFFAGAMGAQKAGASRRGTIFAMIGSMVGAILGALIGIPVPVIGSILAALLFGGVGATLGAMYGEWSDGKTWKESWPIGQAAFWGRTFGTLGKVSVGTGVVFTAIIAVIV